MLCGIFFQIFSYFRIRALIIYDDQTIWNLCLFNSGKQSIKILQSVVNRHDHIHLLLIDRLWICLSRTAYMTLFEMAEISDTLRIFDSVYQKFFLIPGSRDLSDKESSGIRRGSVFQENRSLCRRKNRCQERKSGTFRIRISNGIGHIRTVDRSTGSLLKLLCSLIKCDPWLSHRRKRRIKGPANGI